MSLNPFARKTPIEEAGATSAESEVPAAAEARAIPGPDPATRTADQIHSAVVEALKTVYDPEIPIDIYELGLIYQVDVRDDKSVHLQMTLTSPMCPVAETLPPEVEAKVMGVPGVASVELDLVWEPPWGPAMMSEAARLTLNM
jgi:FeS assembly SUF system protein